jgi:KipI family sensor histidine kinase inhibitor
MIEFFTLNARSILIQGISQPAFYTNALLSELPNIQDIVPSFNEILIVFCSDVQDLQTLKRKIEIILSTPYSKTEATHMRLPICFDEEFAIDKVRISKHTRIQFDQIIKSICSNTFTVSFIGFLPGFPYLSGLPQELETPRHKSPRNSVLEGSFAVAKDQVGIYPKPSPAGWNIIGNCPIPIFDINRKESTLLKPGDRVTFYSITKKVHSELKDQLVIT